MPFVTPLPPKISGGRATLIELAWPAMDSTFQSATWLSWAKAIPDALVHVPPRVLSVAYGWAHINVGELEAAEQARLLEGERWLRKEPDNAQ